MRLGEGFFEKGVNYVNNKKKKKEVNRWSE